MADRKINFIGAGEQDVSEVTISTGSHPVSPADIAARVTYTVSYPEKSAVNPLEINESFAEAAQALINDAAARGVTPGK
ncbi:hypothetical protein [Vibrio jasicida]|uniref:hypothetical protein n=1 Tax=Vibrio jasicida TaxID=766224 RepID=UPI00148DC283|nr:hypothetical protein [Vibrio jasicida]NOJ21075.1 hypothetical protein [Vibrio jasicida]